MKSTDQDSRTFFIDMGSGDWRLAESPATRVTAEQVAAISALEDIDDMGAAEPRFGATTGEITVFHTDGHVTEVTEDGATESLSTR